MMTSILFLMSATLVVYPVFAAPTGFTVVPVTQTVPSGSETRAKFICQHNTADVIGWSLNGISITRHPLHNVTTCSATLPDGYHLLNTLKILPLIEYNETTIVCIAAFFDTGRPSELTNPVMLLIQDNATSLPTGFVETPDSQRFIGINRTLVMALGEEVSLSCQHCEAEFIIWKINGIELTKDTDDGIIVLDVNLSQYCGPIYILNMTANTSYSNTEIYCEAEVSGVVYQESVPVIVLIQGRLDSVSNLMRNISENYDLIAFTWMPPFSLDISRAEPDIAYCVTIYETTCPDRSSTLFLSECNVYQTEYIIPQDTLNLSDNYLFAIEVVPRTNLDVAFNGTPTSYQDSFIFLNSTEVTYIINIDATGNLQQIQFILYLQGVNELQVKPKGLLVQFTSIDNLPNSILSNSLCSLESEVQSNEALAYLTVNNCSESEPDLLRLYSSSLLIQTERCNTMHQLTQSFFLSTHYIQNVSVTAATDIQSQISEFNVSGHFFNITNRPCIGFLAILYPNIGSDDSVPLQYGIAVLEDKLMAEVTIPVSGVHYIDYRTSVFCIQAQNGLPLERSAAIVQNMPVTQTTVNNDLEPNMTQNNIHATFNNKNGCVECTFSGSKSGNSCILIFSEKSQINSKDGLTNIRVESFPKKGTIASGCINTTSYLNFSDLVFAAFRFDTMIIGQAASVPTEYLNNETTIDNRESTTNKLIIIIVTTILAAILYVIVLLTIIIIFIIKKIYIFKIKKKGNKQVKPTIVQELSEIEQRNTQNDQDEVNTNQGFAELKEKLFRKTENSKKDLDIFTVKSTETDTRNAFLY